MALLCVRGAESERYFQRVMMPNESAKDFLTEPQATSENIFRGRVLHHHELEISFGRQEHTVMSLLFNFLQIPPEKS